MRFCDSHFLTEWIKEGLMEHLVCTIRQRKQSQDLRAIW